MIDLIIAYFMGISVGVLIHFIYSNLVENEL